MALLLLSTLSTLSCTGSVDGDGASGADGASTTETVAARTEAVTWERLGLEVYCTADADCLASAPSCGASRCNSAANLCEYSLRPANFECRAPSTAAGRECDAPEVCTGTSYECPADTMDAVKPAGAICRSSAGSCDRAEVCNGSSAACPLDIIQPSGFLCRGAASVCDVAEVCDGTNKVCPSDTFAPPTISCRPAAGDCDSAEMCTGASSLCPADTKLTSVCRPSAGACDIAESCNGVVNECPVDTLVAADTTCRAADGACDVAEVCTGGSPICPNDRVADATSVCRAAVGECDAPEMCNGTAKTCGTDAKLPAATVCRAAVEGTCDKPETCSGTSNTCPSDGAWEAGYVCRPSYPAGPNSCDAPEVCSGTSFVCPPDSLKTAGTSCREAAGPCDVAEVCTGGGRYCPLDEFLPNVTECRPANLANACEGATYCTGNTAACPSTPPPAQGGTYCNPSNAGTIATMFPGRTGGCTGGGFCSGSTLTCPPISVRTSGGCTESCGAGTCNTSGACAGKTPVAAGTGCRGSRGACDIADSCNGVDMNCPDAFQPSTFECRASAIDTRTGTASVCDPAEMCSGSSPYCPRDARAPNDTVCRSSAGTCDNSEYCSGTTPTPTSTVADAASAQCGVDRFVTAGTICRFDRLNGCDTEEVCSGSGPTCPADVGLGSTHICRAKNESQACDSADYCTNNPADACPEQAPSPAGTVCRAASGVCDVAESCTGSSFDCPTTDVRAPAGTLCRASNGAPCDVGETCDGRTSACPANRVAINGTVCRAAAPGGCDVAELCNGATDSCPAEAFKPAGTVCSYPTQACEGTGVCSGSQASCPVAYAPRTVECRPSGGNCDVAEFCTGSQLSCPTNIRVAGGTVCRASTDTFCDPAESCTGTSDVCPSNVVRPDGDEYDQNGDLCDGIDYCLSGMITPPSTSVTNCDDGNPCTADSCHPTLGCQNVAVANGIACDTDSFCVQEGTETCQAGECVGTERDCGVAYDAVCLETNCDEVEDRCVVAPAPSRPATCADQSIKPYMLLVLDNSGSMNTDIPSDPSMPIDPENSCGRERTRMSDAKCAVTNLVSTYGEAVFGLASYTTTGSGSTNISPAAECDTICDTGGCSYTSLNCSTCDPSTGTGCPLNGADATQGTVVSPILDDNQPDLLRWTDFGATTCSTNAGTSSNPELVADPQTFTPLAGVLNSARAYFENGVPARSWPSPVDLTNTCRPYYVVLLTDGQESCAQLEQTRAAAAALRTTMIPGRATPLNVRTYVIALGVSSPTELARLGDLAEAGGTSASDTDGDGLPDGPGVITAENEADIALAFAQILERTILVEVCNNVDDNCNGLIDEGFTKYCAGAPCTDDRRTLCEDPGDPCNGIDDNGVNGIADEVRNRCGACGDDREICDGIDNNCDGRVDEHDESQPRVGGVYPACTCSPRPEICDGLDNDCDGRRDEDLVRDCGSDVGECARGTQVCNLGSWGPCGGVGPAAEVCDNKDNDCDGVVDGIGELCGEYGIPQADGSLAFYGQCMAGERTCVTGAWTECSGGTGPSAEVCDGVDNDCDMTIDEGNPGGGADCNSACGPGTVSCVAGRLICTSGSGGTTEICDGIDNDCDGEVDEDIADGAACNFLDLGCEDGTIPSSDPRCSQMLCVPGVRRCVAGVFRCAEGRFEEPEACDCLDNDCDGTTDENNDDGSNICGEGGATCLGEGFCQCARPCATGTEFPCPSGQICTDLANPGAGFCVRDPCVGVSCPAGRSPLADGNTCECVGQCELLECPTGYFCREGRGCIVDSCEGDPDRCTTDQFCVNGECEDNLCDGVNCPEGLFCRAGACRSSCAGVVCSGGSRCEDGACTDNLCASVTCDTGASCDPTDGTCKPNLCGGIRCGSNSTCNPVTGTCETNLCLGVVCPNATEVCVDGECVTASGDIDGGVQDPEDRVLATGGGGWACSTANGSGDSSALGWLLTMGAIAIFVSRRGRGGVR